MVLWYISRYIADRKRLRAMTKDNDRPYTWPMALAICFLIASIALWVIAPPSLPGV